jgi:hypothetical protein
MAKRPRTRGWVVFYSPPIDVRELVLRIVAGLVLSVMLLAWITT